MKDATISQLRSDLGLHQLKLNYKKLEKQRIDQCNKLRTNNLIFSGLLISTVVATATEETISTRLIKEVDDFSEICLLFLNF